MTTPAHELRARLREQAPELAALVDGLRAEFGAVKVTYLRIGGEEYGLRPDASRRVALSDATPAQQVIEEWWGRANAAIDAHQRKIGKPRQKKGGKDV